MAPKAARQASKPRSAKRRAAKRTTRRARKAVKATKPRKPKRVTKKMQTGSLRKVWNGSKKFTPSGLTKKDLMLNKRGRVMSKAAHKKGQNLKKSPWFKAVMQARRELGITGFCAINRGTQGIELYNRAKELCN